MSPDNGVSVQVLRAGRVFTARGGSPIVDGVVVFEAGRIRRVGSASDFGLDLRPTVHYAAATVLPGLIDAHCHVSLPGDGRSYEAIAGDSDAQLAGLAAQHLSRHLEAGITLVRDNGGRNHLSLDVRAARSRAELVGPRVLTAGRPITTPGGHLHLCNETARGPAELRRAVEQLVSEGVDHIKFVASGGGTAGTLPHRASYSVAELRAGVESAHALGVLTTAHCRSTESMWNALTAGIDCIEHADFLDVEGHQTFDAALAAALLEHGTYISFTFQAGGLDRLLALRVGACTRAEHFELQRLESHFAAKVNLFESMLASGLQPLLVISTDAGTGDAQFGRLHEGIALAVSGGMSPEAAIVSVTRTAAAACNQLAHFGTLEAGKTADLCIVDGDPTRSIQALANVRAVYQSGTLVYGT